ncbi:MAG: hypothetical protein HZB82_05950 [Deltaproteobacteria bacterium]|nr:hypothetical protein [Deltaproteobacteria bacterium]
MNDIGWPHVTLVFAAFFIIIFRKALNGLISRVTSIDKSGVKVAPTPEIQREEQKKEFVQELLLAAGDSVMIRDIEERIKTELTSKGLETNGDTVVVLIKHLAATQLFLKFEQTHSVIFGSQIFLLKKLNEVAGQGKPQEFIVAHFENTKKIYPATFEKWSLEQYLSFLFSWSLLTVKDNNYHITNLGVDYLTWIARYGKSEDKLY